MELNKYKSYYIICDLIAASTSWALFSVYRKIFIESEMYGFDVRLHIGLNFFFNVTVISLFWFIIYYTTGYYNNILRKSRLEDFSKTIFASFFGVIFVFFIFILDDYIDSYKEYYSSFLVIFLLHFCLTLFPRLIITSYILQQIKRGFIKFNTIIIGRIERINQIIWDLNTKYPQHGHHIIGCITVDNEIQKVDNFEFQKFGTINDIHTMVKKEQAKDVIIALNEDDGEIYGKIIYELNSSNTVIKVNPEFYPAVKGHVEISSLFRYPLIEISRDLLTPWQSTVKQIVDIIGAFIGLLITLPISLALVFIIKLTSKGPVFYSHERIGKFGKPFHIIKFRSMYKDAETNGPQLSSTSDTRVTPVGKIMRRTKLDEIPNFINVLKGEMSLVGPRPERLYYINQIVKQSPEYTRLFKVKPGVTSWGQVKFGYAEDVNEMIRRMRYDLLYIENMSLYVDLQIMIKTLQIILRGRGKW